MTDSPLLQKRGWARAKFHDQPDPLTHSLCNDVVNECEQLWQKKKQSPIFLVLVPCQKLHLSWLKLHTGFFVTIFFRRHQLEGRFFHHDQSSLMVWTTASRQIQIPKAFEKALSSKRWRQWRSLRWENRLLRQPDNYRIKRHENAMNMLTELCRCSSLHPAAMWRLYVSLIHTVQLLRNQLISIS